LLRKQECHVNDDNIDSIAPFEQTNEHHADQQGYAAKASWLIMVDHHGRLMSTTTATKPHHRRDAILILRQTNLDMDCLTKFHFWKL
jgi:hypothetical protein